MNHHQIIGTFGLSAQSTLVEVNNAVWDAGLRGTEQQDMVSLVSHTVLYG